jgi:hypothetical protein
MMQTLLLNPAKTDIVWLSWSASMPMGLPMPPQHDPRVVTSITDSRQCAALLLLMQTLLLNPAKTDIDSFVPEDFTLLDYNPHKKIEMKMAV